MRTDRNSGLLVGLALMAAVANAGAQTGSDIVLDRAQRQVATFFNKMADLTCTEEVVQEKIRADGHIEARAQGRFDYLIMVSASKDDFSLNESRIEAQNTAHKPLPLLVTNGFSMLLLVLHPYYRDSFHFTAEPEQYVDGWLLLPLRFDHVAGTRSVAALELRGREYPLDLQGTAWIDRQSGRVMKIDANLARDMSDVGLRSLSIDVSYKLSNAPGAGDTPLPYRAVIDLETPRQHWRNTHSFTDYKSFSAAAQQSTQVHVVTKETDQEQNDKSTQQPTPPQEQY